MTRKVLNLDNGNWLPCCWADCMKVGYEQFKVRVSDGSGYVQYVFCSYRHKMMFVNSHRSYGNLPSGLRGLIR